MEIRLTDPTDLPFAADVLADAFRDYAWTRHVIPDEAYEDRLRSLQLLYLQYAHEQGLVAVAEGDDGAIDGVIALVAPGAPDPSPDTVRRVVELHGDRIDRLSHPSESDAAAWRLETLGVRSSRQGAGLASALLGFARSAVARRGGGFVTLETSDPRNVRLYERHEFGVVSHGHVSGQPPVWRMRTLIGAD